MQPYNEHAKTYPGQRTKFTSRILARAHQQTIKALASLEYHSKIWYTCEKLTMTGRIWVTQSCGSNNFPRAAQPSTANNRTESWSENKSD